MVKLLDKGPMDPRELPGRLNIDEGRTEEAFTGLMVKEMIFLVGLICPMRLVISRILLIPLLKLVRKLM